MPDIQPDDEYFDLENELTNGDPSKISELQNISMNKLLIYKYYNRVKKLNSLLDILSSLEHNK